MKQHESSDRKASFLIIFEFSCRFLVQLSVSDVDRQIIAAGELFIHESFCMICENKNPIC